MSRSGALIYYYTADICDPEIALDKVREWLIAEWVLMANQTKSESHLWDRVQRRLTGVSISLSEDCDIICARCEPSLLRGKYITGRKMTVDFNKSVLTDSYCQRHAEIDERIRGDFNPGTPIVTLGPHDIITVDEDEGFKLIDRASFSVRVWGYGTPLDRSFYEGKNGVWEEEFSQEFLRGLNRVLEMTSGRCASSFDI